MVCTVVLVFLAFVLTLASAVTPPATTRVVNTDCGPVRGYLETSASGNKAFVYKGIPFAKPPTGNRRWNPPEDLSKKHGVQCWPGTFDAKTFASPCTQSSFAIFPRVIGQEDCLYLNVWTRVIKRRRLRPVLFWIHGGATLRHSSSIPGYSPNPDILKTMDVVAVSVAYRLNAFGFLVLKVLASNSPTKTSGNYGIMDVIKGLEWVKKNIRKFGGDPNRVTLIGESAGAKISIALRASPLANGLFHRVIAFSGGAGHTKTSKEAAKDNEIFVRKAKCNTKTDAETLRCLYSLSTVQAFHSIPWLEYPFWALPRYYDIPAKNEQRPPFIVVDGHVVAVSPERLAYQYKHQFDLVPIIIVTVPQEGETVAARKLTKTTFQAAVRKTLGTFPKRVMAGALRLYMRRCRSSLLNYGLAYINMASDIRVNCPNDLLGWKLSLIGGQEIYRLTFDHWPNTPVIWEGVFKYAFHGWLAMTFFNYQIANAGGPGKLYSIGKGDLKSMNFLHREFYHFMVHGYPRSGRWGTYPDYVAVYQRNRLKIQWDDYSGKECRFWNRNGFYRYAWAL